MEFELLGPVGVRHVPITSAQQRSILAVLLLEAGRVVSVDRLVDLLWDGDHMPRRARNVVQVNVSALRRKLGPARCLTHKPPGYVLQVPRPQIDLHHFRAQVTTIRSTATDPGVRARMLRRALDIWQGDPLADADAPGLAPVRRALAEERLAVLEECLAAESHTGLCTQSIAELRVLVAAHPLRERLSALLMLALYRGGRPADALQVFHDTRRALADETGTEPGPELRAVYEQVLRHDPVLEQPGRPAIADRPGWAEPGISR
ncbi:hypothetical protein D5S17_15030 [Pseudonocardiaceae bacterium YIM PH 21723]|nr:hypothetical protein D5S17_15030 [Pseudonocardiaceae bacterium YIM PH 21723]